MDDFEKRRRFLMFLDDRVFHPILEGSKGSSPLLQEIYGEINVSTLLTSWNNWFSGKTFRAGLHG